MDDKTNQAPEQSGMPDNEEYSSYTLPTEDAAAQEAHTIPLEDAAAQESRTIPLEDERTQGAQDSAAQPPTLSSQTIRPPQRTARPANRRTARKPSLRATA